MTLTEEQKKVQRAMNAALSGLQEDPWLTQRVLANAKGEKPVKRKLSLALILSILIVIACMATAAALFSSRVAEFFGRHWGHDYGDWLQGGKIAQIGETVSLGGVDFTLDEVVYRGLGLYGVGTARAKSPRDVLLSMDLADGWDPEEVSQGEEAQALIRQARGSGGRMLSINCYPGRIGVDQGSMMSVGDVGLYNLRNEDGSVTFSFETGGAALQDGTTYQLELWIDVDEWTEDGVILPDPVEPERWMVSFAPVLSPEADPPAESTPMPPEAIPQGGYEVLTPARYREQGTMPVYRALENDFTQTVNPGWFNRSGITESVSGKRDRRITFADHAELSISPEGIFYEEYTDELFDYNARERAEDTPDIEPMLLPRMALSQGIADIAAGVYFGYGYADGVTLERDQLTLISLAQARQTAEELFERLGLQGYELAWALDLGLDRIRSLGEAYNHFWYETEGATTNAPRQDYSAATAEDEGYLLIYTPLGVPKVSDGRHQIRLFVSCRGIVEANIVSAYRLGGVAAVPDSLIPPQEAVSRLYAEAAQSRGGETTASIERIALTYVPVRAEDKREGMVFIPSWQVLYRAGDARGHDGWAEFSALDGALIDAIFR